MRRRDRFAMRECPAIGGHHPRTDPTGQKCEACAAAMAERLARCAVTHSERSATYPDGEGVQRFHCCYARTDGGPD
jgi:hypothetical protein